MQPGKINCGLHRRNNANFTHIPFEKYNGNDKGTELPLLTLKQT